VDAGHGGSSSGATFGGVQEKNITLAISLKLRACLEACGAKVVMTRDRDVTVPLYDRPNLANAINADLFVSVHNDDTERTNSASGTSTYYHKGDASSHALAVCVQQAVMAVSGLPSRGALSDGILYSSGLAVLRCSSMPAVLVEVAYINNQRDRRKLVDDDFQQHVAQAICDGLRHYVEGSPETVRHTPSSAGIKSKDAAQTQVMARLDH
jgi:N-acetylmuramoyl-L-alanine amidase